MCAHLSGLPMQPCFRVEKIDYRSFRGSIAGLGFAYCDFSQHNARAQIISRGPEPRTRITSRMPAPAQTAPVQDCAGADRARRAGTGGAGGAGATRAGADRAGPGDAERPG